MTEKEIKEINKAPAQPKKVEQEKKLITLTGITTSQIWTKEDTPAYCFLKNNENKEDVPIIFRIKEKKCQVIPCPECRYPKRGNWEKQAHCQTREVKHQLEEVWIKPKIPKHSYLQVEGYLANSDKQRPSFTVTSYQFLNQAIEIKGGRKFFTK